MLSLVEATLKVLIRVIIWTVKSQAPSSYSSSLDTSICGLELDFQTIDILYSEATIKYGISTKVRIKIWKRHLHIHASYLWEGLLVFNRRVFHVTEVTGSPFLHVRHASEGTWSTWYYISTSDNIIDGATSELHANFHDRCPTSVKNVRRRLIERSECATTALRSKARHSKLQPHLLLHNYGAFGC